MTKLIGIKELQKNTKRIRKEIEKGVQFIVIYRSKPVFALTPLTQGIHFADDLEATGLYEDTFIKNMREAEKNISDKKLRTYSTEKFLKSLTD